MQRCPGGGLGGVGGEGGNAGGAGGVVKRLRGDGGDAGGGGSSEMTPTDSTTTPRSLVKAVLSCDATVLNERSCVRNVMVTRTDAGSTASSMSDVLTLSSVLSASSNAGASNVSTVPATTTLVCTAMRVDAWPGHV